MADGTEFDAVEEIGQTAGLIWQYLNEQGTVSVSKLLKGVEAPRDLVLQGLGWLTREDKVAFAKTARGKTVSLK